MGSLFSTPETDHLQSSVRSAPPVKRSMHEASTPIRSNGAPEKRQRQTYNHHSSRSRTRTSSNILPLVSSHQNGSTSAPQITGGKPRQHHDRADRDHEEDREEDIRAVVTADAPVKAAHLLRATRREDGTLVIDTGGKPLYTEAFLENLGVEPLVKAAKDSRAARLDARENQCNFLDFELRRRLRKRQVSLERSTEALALWSDQGFADGRLGALAERDKRKIDMTGKIYLAPLTTVGNLPFRRVCKRLGADVTCGEMALAGNLLQGQNSEWALLRRHKSEDLFGVQLAGSNVETVTRAAELVARECEVDFLELNAGCPIDVVFNRGGGCSLMKRRAKLQRMVWSIGQVADVPVGVKVRTGISERARNAHEVIQDMGNAGAGWITVHGRSRKQRYSKLADWGYISEACGTAARDAGIALLGNGDVYNWRDVTRHMETGCVQGIMVARGALIKPWVLTEVHERRDWDIRSTERLEIYKEFARYGLEHWGGDEKGVETTRRFLLEWLSFLYRYVPVGLLECGEGKYVTMSHRAPLFRGRDELETLLGSRHCGDWVRISEMLLGKVPAGFRFRPRHKSNAWGGAEDDHKG